LGQSRLSLLASPDYLNRHGTPLAVADLHKHTLIGFSQLDHLNQWPLPNERGATLAVSPDISASSGMTIQALALAGQGIVCLADYMTRSAREQGLLVPIMRDQVQDSFQIINAVYYRNTQLSLRITLFLDFIAEHLRERL